MPERQERHAPRRGSQGASVTAFHLFDELKRRNVLRAAALYAGAVWTLAQGIAQLGPALGTPDWVTRRFVVAAAVGLPFWRPLTNGDARNSP